MGILARLKSIYVEVPVRDQAVWHKRLRAPLLARDTRGRLMIFGDGGQIWRRRRAGKWEYQQDPETLDDVEARSW